MDKFNERVRMRGQGGFTLIELLVVIAILAVLGGAVVIGIGALRGNAEEEACKTDRETIETAAEAYKVVERAPYPRWTAADPRDGLASLKTVRLTNDPCGQLRRCDDVTALRPSDGDRQVQDVADATATPDRQ